jgi:hypothetical protein
VSEALAGAPVGIAELETGDHVVRFCGHDLGWIDRVARRRQAALPAARPSTIVPVRNVDLQTG